MQLIETKTLGTTQSSIVFSDIPQTFTDLMALVSVRSNRTGDTLDILTLAFNGVTTSRASRELVGDGSSTSSANYTNGRIGIVNSADSTSNTFSNFSIYVPNYTAAVNKSATIDGVMEHNATRAFQNITSFLWSSAAAITSLTIDLDIADLVAGSTISLYGIGPDARSSQAKATGGTIYRSGNFWVHEFTSSGTFTATESLSGVECLVIAGGGAGGGNSGGGGGGAGGYRASSIGSLSSGSYAIVVGAGGTGAVSGSTNGSNSSFNSIVATGGGASPGYNLAGNSGGSGGGAHGGVGSALSGGAGNTPSTSPSQGNNGGDNAGSGFLSSGGGGGAGAAGSKGAQFQAGNGGAGLSSSITGVAVTRAGGGGGGMSDYSYGAGAGGAGGGGNGTFNTVGPGGNGTANTGGGGGGCGKFNTAGGNGGSGVVIVRYAA